MEYLKIPEYPILSGNDAIKALYDFKNELEGQRGKELTEKQIAALTKLANGLIDSIKAETRSRPSVIVRKAIPDSIESVLTRARLFLKI